MLGLHLEGPYINPEKKGAHIAACIKKATVDEVKMLLEKGKGIIKMMTLAPELCDDSIIELLLQNDIIVSAGHTNANYQQARKGFAKGIPAATHLYNAMSKSGLWTARINDVLQFTTTTNGTGFQPLRCRLGRGASNFSEFFNGEMAELLIFDRELTAAERDAVAAQYLRKRYNLW